MGWSRAGPKCGMTVSLSQRPVTVDWPRTIAKGHGQTVADEFGVVTRGSVILL